MENLTYEFEQTKNALETYEWDNIWCLCTRTLIELHERL